MAKAKKQSTQPASKSPSPAAEKPAGKKSAASKKAARPAGTTTSAPMIDTSLAAAAAAKMVANRDMLAPAGPTRESNSFKQMKESLSKPAATGPASFLHSSAPQKKSNMPFGGRNQVGHNQTFGADVNRSGVPRRTGG